MSIVIDKGIPLPPRRWANKGVWEYPFDKMEIGDSILITSEDKSRPLKRENVYWLGSHAGKILGRKFSCRKVDGGMRIWRVE